MPPAAQGTRQELAFDWWRVKEAERLEALAENSGAQSDRFARLQTRCRRFFELSKRVGFGTFILWMCLSRGFNVDNDALRNIVFTGVIFPCSILFLVSGLLDLITGAISNRTLRKKVKATIAAKLLREEHAARNGASPSLRRTLRVAHRLRHRGKPSLPR